MKLKKQTNGVKAMSEKVLLEIGNLSESGTLLVVEMCNTEPRVRMGLVHGFSGEVKLTPRRIAKLVKVLTGLQQKEQSNKRGESDE